MQEPIACKRSVNFDYTFFVSPRVFTECAVFLQQITPAFVREAYSLLKQSIIHVEKDDVEMDDEDDEDNNDNGQGGPGDGMDEDGPRPSDLPSSPTRAQSPVTPAPAPAPRKKVVVSYDKYMSIATLLNTYLSEQERQTGTGVSRGDLKQWYMEQREEDLNTLEELEEEQVLIDKVMKKLVKEKQLLELRGEIADSQDAGEDTQELEENQIIVMGKLDALPLWSRPSLQKPFGRHFADPLVDVVSQFTLTRNRVMWLSWVVSIRIQGT